MAGLLEALKGYFRDALPGGALNPEGAPIAERGNYLAGILDPNSAVSRDAQNWHQKVQNGLVDQLAGRQTPAAEYAYNQLMNMAGVAPLGMTAWHGSPHKFDKFDLSKIGTGEGAQAYGHGLYLAESPEVAKGYQQTLSKTVRIDGKDAKSLGKSDDAAALVAAFGGDIDKAIAYQKKVGSILPDMQQKIINRLEELRGRATTLGGNLYKTDIPDEAVARFLDWDKPLSQQAPEVQAAFRGHIAESQFNPESAWNAIKDKTGGEAYQTLAGRNSHLVSEGLSQQGIPGIRYLDGGSRSAGQGSSNFVVFDPEMIRILERNGQATGAQAWKPGEWNNRKVTP